jgi:hypothetical protein
MPNRDFSNWLGKPLNNARTGVANHFSCHEKAILLDEVMKFNSAGGFWTASIKVFVPNAIGGIEAHGCDPDRHEAREKAEHKLREKFRDIAQSVRGLGLQ